jgi:hypothetical protein
VYISFLELGMAALAREDAWICLTVKRSKDVKTYHGGMAQVFGKLLQFMFSTAFNLALSGVLLGVGPVGLRMFAKLGIIVQDGAAHRDTYHCKGDGGTKFCMLCRNIVAQKSNLANGGDDSDTESDDSDSESGEADDVDGEEAADSEDEAADASQSLKSDVIDERHCVFATDANVRTSIKFVADAAARKDPELKLIEQAYGYTHQ